ncbi:MAG TPA: peptidylprolyl isomerase [Deltaproteobacteria bacterium]|nr:peptidylprolyl isomerase [Deltaproteobacteria bacterium]
MLLSVLAVVHGGAAWADTIEGIVAVVDERLIMRSDLDARLEEMGVDPLDTARVQRVLDIMVEDIVVEKTYAKYGLPPVDPQQVTAVAQQNRSSYAFARAVIMRKMLMDMMVASRVVVTPQMVRNYYEATPKYSGRPALQLEQIAIKDDAERTARAMAALKDGRSFEEVAKSFSDLLTGGSANIGWVPLDHLDQAARTPLENAKEGDIVGPIAIGGYSCIFKVVGRDTIDRKDLDEVRDEITASLEDRSREQAFEYWLKLTMSEHFIYKQKFSF